ncbi:hypothetical protein HYPSUDRAFT_440314 [Hypholoma sublateritium FD-334 SS-4]|uniref:Uncharacterized protein n=1 Tax=Hypholoma sublateritium (strain FD-334 SS-4) TaxID=945553 RepID=A0A0D2P9B7_HYPSF|nr:hypothetical protein HYPSUDRAFT_440314 [Hypholoma sublateritium FD-334 SS-4]
MWLVLVRCTLYEGTSMLRDALRSLEVGVKKQKGAEKRAPRLSLYTLKENIPQRVSAS